MSLHKNILKNPCSKFMALSLMLLLSHPTQAGGDIADPGIHDFFASHKIASTFDEDSFSNLVDFVGAMLVSLEQEIKDAKALKDDKKEEDAKDNKKFFERAKAYLDVVEPSSDVALKVKQFNLAKRVIYAVKAKEPTGKNSKLKMLWNIVRRIDTTLAYTVKEDRDKEVGNEQAKKEAAFLVSPQDPNKRLSPDELSKLTTSEIADLDISEDHPYWHTVGNTPSDGNEWEDLEKWASKRINKKLKDKNPDIAKYKIHEARKVVFFKEIKNSATSPKVMGKDAFGEKWKVKWGNEVQVEPLNNRLYLKMGGKHSDLVYSNAPGVDGLVLVLNDPKAVTSKNPETCENIIGVEMLRKCLLRPNDEGGYAFLIDPYILEQGKITDENIDRVLKNLKDSGYKNKEGIEIYKKENMVGRTFLTFKESLVELKSNKIMTKGAAAAGSFFGAEMDRAARGSVIFNMWIWNLDAKDLNSKAVILKKRANGEDVYVEYQHDLGASLGKPRYPGQLNNLDSGKDFIHLNGSETRVKFPQFLLYRPKAWKSSTFADALWMAKKVAQVKKSDLEEIAIHSGWPKFMQDLYVHRLLLRRNDIAKIYGVESLLDIKEIKPLNLSIDMKTPEARKKASDKFKIPLKTIESILSKIGMLNEDGSSEYEDMVLVNGKINSCDSSIVANLMEKIHHPSGLTRRVDRDKDDKALKKCVLTQRGLTEKR
jgi:hypothetical protein